MAGKIESDHRNAFKVLLHLDALRGTDSTGIACVEKGKDPSVDILKTASHPYDLMDHNRFDKIVIRPNRVMIGHNRYATHGKVITRNAHPFHVGKIVGVHNGVINNKWNFDNGNQFDVDSLALFNHIDQKGLKDAIDRAKGGWSLVWWNTEEETLNFLRNEERPMFIGVTEDGQTIMWASERWMLEVAASRNKIKFKEVNSTDINKHIKLPIEIDGKFGESAEEEVKSSPAAPFQPFRQHGSGINPQAVGQAISQRTQAATQNGGVGSNVTRFPTIPYTGQKGRLLRATTLVNAIGGATYLICNDLELNVLGTIRLYVNKKDNPEQMRGKVFRADISGTADYESAGGLVYKVIHSTVDFNWNRKQEQQEEQQEEQEKPEHILGPRGVYLSRSAWEKYYGRCSLCDSDIDPDENHHRFLVNGEVICGSCADDPQVMQYLPAFETRH